MPYSSRHAQSLAELLMRQGDIAAQRAQNAGAVWGSVARGVGSIPGQIQQRKLADRAAQIEEAQIASRLDTDAMQRQNIQSQIDERGHARMDEQATKDLALTTQKVSAWLGEVASAPDAESRKMAYQVGRDALVKEGRLTLTDAPEFFPGQSWVKARMAQLLPAAERFKQMFPEPEKGVVLPRGAQMRSPTTGDMLADNPMTPDAPAVGSFEDFVTSKYGARPTPEQIAEGRRIYNQADDRVATAGGQLSPAMESNVLNRLTTQWTTAVKPVAELTRQIKMMDAGLDAARRGNLAQGAQAVLVTFQKILDPTSVVRESEYARSAAGLALDARIKGAVERLAKGGAGVPLNELEAFARVARDAANRQSGGYIDAVKERIGRTADRYKIPRDIVFEEFSFADATAPPGGTSGADAGEFDFDPATGQLVPRGVK